MLFWFFIRCYVKAKIVGCYKVLNVLHEAQRLSLLCILTFLRILWFLSQITVFSSSIFLLFDFLRTQSFHELISKGSLIDSGNLTASSTCSFLRTRSFHELVSECTFIDSGNFAAPSACFRRNILFSTSTEITPVIWIIWATSILFMIFLKLVKLSLEHHNLLDLFLVCFVLFFFLLIKFTLLLLLSQRLEATQTHFLTAIFPFLIFLI